MKLLVFAHSPPPHHGQSYMVELMLKGLGGDGGIQNSKFKIQNSVQCFQVNCRFSDSMEDIGEMHWSKAWLLLRYCAEALWHRIRHGADHLYYIPAPGKRVALYRDWVVLFLCRPFFKRTIFHWHASGLGDWLHHEGTWIERWITRTLLGGPALSLSLAISNMRDALWFRSWQVEIVPNGIPDPCPDFEQAVQPRRQARVAARRALLAGEQPVEADAIRAGGDPQLFKVLYLAHCTRDKGVFDTLDGVALANKFLRDSGSALRVHLTVAGAFLEEGEEREFRHRIAEADLGEAAVTSAGFVSGDAKWKLFRECDCFCFPTYYAAEGQPVSLLEAMAFGMGIVTTAWRAIPEMLPPEFPCFVPPRAPQRIASTFQLLFRTEEHALRDRFLAHFSEARHLERLRDALGRV